MAWKNAQYENNDADTPNNTVCESCGLVAGAHLVADAKDKLMFGKCPTEPKC